MLFVWGFCFITLAQFTMSVYGTVPLDAKLVVKTKMNLDFDIQEEGRAAEIAKAIEANSGDFDTQAILKSPGLIVVIMEVAGIGNPNWPKFMTNNFHPDKLQIKDEVEAVAVDGTYIKKIPVSMYYAVVVILTKSQVSRVVSDKLAEYNTAVADNAKVNLSTVATIEALQVILKYDKKETEIADIDLPYVDGFNFHKSSKLLQSELSTDSIRNAVSDLFENTDFLTLPNQVELSNPAGGRKPLSIGIAIWVHNMKLYVVVVFCSDSKELDHGKPGPLTFTGETSIQVDNTKEAADKKDSDDQEMHGISLDV